MGEKTGAGPKKGDNCKKSKVILIEHYTPTSEINIVSILIDTTARLG